MLLAHWNGSQMPAYQISLGDYEDDLGSMGWQKQRWGTSEIFTLFAAANHILRS